ncbi:MAG TPA: hypothetical protein VFC67_14950 [Prolixibacteraceae bacterium]|nr:hypothetical protein [Prolixibacteraceae bacterium]
MMKCIMEVHGFSIHKTALKSFLNKAKPVGRNYNPYQPIGRYCLLCTDAAKTEIEGKIVALPMIKLL